MRRSLQPPPHPRRRCSTLLRVVVPFALILVGLGLIFLGFGSELQAAVFAGFALMGLGTLGIVLFATRAGSFDWLE